MAKKNKLTPIVVESPISDFHLTKGKQYVTDKYWEHDVTDKYWEHGQFNSFHIKDDKGIELYCLFKECAHLNGKDWIIVPKYKS